MDHDTKRPEYPNGENTSELGSVPVPRGERRELDFDAVPAWLLWSLAVYTAALFLLVYFCPAAAPVAG